MPTAFYMEWKTDHNLLSKKILERIAKSKAEVSYSDLEQVAVDKNIDLNIFDAAITKLHRFKKVTQRVKGEEIYYKAVPKPKRKAPGSHLTWLRNNYPYPKKFVMPFPEIDMSWIFLTPDEMLEYKAQAKGMPSYMMKRIHKNHGKS